LQLARKQFSSRQICRNLIVCCVPANNGPQSTAKSCYWSLTLTPLLVLAAAAVSPLQAFIHLRGSLSHLNRLCLPETQTMAWLLVVAALAGLAAERCAATDHIVGANHGWNPNINYSLWSGNQTFYVGDLICKLLRLIQLLDPLGIERSLNANSAIW
jgi:hypothetical protein